MNLGWCDVCLNVQDLAASRSFYEKIGMVAVDGNANEGYWIMVNGSARIGLYKNCFEGFMINFRGGEVAANAELLKGKGLTLEPRPIHEADGSDGATLIDPDGNLIYLNTHPDELNPDYQKKIGVL